jgi:hypothetical protein
MYSKSSIESPADPQQLKISVRLSLDIKASCLSFNLKKVHLNRSTGSKLIIINSAFYRKSTTVHRKINKIKNSGKSLCGVTEEAVSVFKNYPKWL